jgi:hypothetical protein
MLEQLKKHLLPLFLDVDTFENAYLLARQKKDIPDEVAQYFHTYYAKNGMIDSKIAFKDLYIELLKPYTLNLTLKKQWFDLMVTGEKKHEFREATAWLYSRIFNAAGHEKKYKLVNFTNGYATNSRAFICEYKGIEHAEDSYSYFDLSYSDGSKITGSVENIYIITLGEILATYNLTK